MSEVKDAPKKTAAEKPSPAADAAPAAGPSPEAAKERPLVPLPEASFQVICDPFSSFGRVWGATIPSGTPWDHVLKDEFWSNNARRMNPFDEIKVRHQDNEYYAVLLVRSTRTVGASREKNRATVQVLERYDLNRVEPGLDVSAFAIAHQHRRGWCVIRVATNEVIHEGFADVPAAELARRLAAQAEQKRTPAA